MTEDLKTVKQSTIQKVLAAATGRSVRRELGFQSYQIIVVGCKGNVGTGEVAQQIEKVVTKPDT